MKALIFAILLSALGSASAQTAHTWQLGIYDPNIDATQALGTATVKGVIYPANTPLVYPTSNPAMNTIHTYYVATMFADNNSILSTICPADWGDQAEATAADLQAESSYLKELTYASANAVVTYGNYYIVFIKLAGPKTPIFIRPYVVKKLNGSYCMTKDLDADTIYWNVYELMMNYL